MKTLFFKLLLEIIPIVMVTVQWSKTKFQSWRTVIDRKSGWTSGPRRRNQFRYLLSRRNGHPLNFNITKRNDNHCSDEFVLFIDLCLQKQFLATVYVSCWNRCLYLNDVHFDWDFHYCTNLCQVGTQLENTNRLWLSGIYIIATIGSRLDLKSEKSENFYENTVKIKAFILDLYF